MYMCMVVQVHLHVHVLFHLVFAFVEGGVGGRGGGHCILLKTHPSSNILTRFYKYHISQGLHYTFRFCLSYKWYNKVYVYL